MRRGLPQAPGCRSMKSWRAGGAGVAFARVILYRRDAADPEIDA
jgi:hypothetical protein